MIPVKGFATSDVTDEPPDQAGEGEGERIVQVQNTPLDRSVPKVATPPTPEQVELSEEERKFLAECEAAYESNPNELYTLDEVLAYIKRKK